MNKEISWCTVATAPRRETSGTGWSFGTYEGTVHGGWDDKRAVESEVETEPMAETSEEPRSERAFGHS